MSTIIRRDSTFDLRLGYGVLLFGMTEVKELYYIESINGIYFLCSLSFLKFLLGLNVKPIEFGRTDF